MTGSDGLAEDTLTALLRIHREVLEVDGIGADDNFYDHGGNSLLALRVIKRIAEDLGIRAPAKAVFTARSVRDLARQVDAARSRDAAPAPRATGPEPRSGRASMAQEWALLAAIEDPDAPALQFHVAYRLGGPLETDVLRQALQSVIDHHAGLRTTFRVSGSAVTQEVADTVPADLRVEDLAGVPEAERLGLALDILDTEVRRPFDRTTAPLTRALLVRCAPDDHLLALVFDHIAADGWSLDIITRDLTESYEALLAGERPSLPPTGSYLRFAAQQWEGYDNGRAEEVAAYWKEQLGPDPSAFAVRLPGYLANTGLSGPAALALDVPAATAEALSRACRELRTTPYCVSLAALKALIARQTGTSRVVVLTTSANRLDPDHQGTVGWFANGVFPVSHVDLSLTFRRFVDDVRSTSLAATVHGDLPASYVRRRMWPGVPSGFRKDPGVYFMFNDLWGGSLRLGKTAVEPVFLDEHADSPGLHMWLLQDGESLRLQALHYRSEYSGPYVRRFAGEFLAAVAALSHEPDRPIRDVLPPTGS